MDVSNEAIATAVTWSEVDVVSFLKTVAAPQAQAVPNETGFKPSIAEVRPDFVRPIAQFCHAIASDQFDQAETTLSHGRVWFADAIQEFEEWFSKCSLLFGAERDLRIVKYFVEVKNVSRGDLFGNPKWQVDFSIYCPRSWDNNYARNALLFAMDSGNIEVVEYLLHDWIHYPSVWRMDHTYSGFFDSENYFDQVFQRLPTSFCQMSFNEQSLWYFSTRYLSSRFWDGSENTVLEKLEADEMLLVRILQLYDTVNDGCIGSYAVWELYGHDQALSMANMDNLEAIPNSFHNFQSFRYPSRGQQSRLEMLSSWTTARNTKLRTAASTLLSLHKDWDQFERQWRKIGGLEWPPFAYPFHHGLRLVAGRLYNKVLLRESQRAMDFMSNLPDNSPDSNLGSGPIDQVNQTDQPEICYMLATAGSGKTHRMFNMLRQHFGFYLVSGAVRREELPTDPGERLYRPRTSTACADTELLVRTIEQDVRGQQLAPLGTRRRHQVVFQHQCELLLLSRLILFFEVYQLRPGFRIEPWQWLQYQLFHNGNSHAFRSLFHSLILCGATGPWGLHQVFPWQRAEEELKFLWCFDEVQCDTALVVAEGDRTTIYGTEWNESENVLSSLMTSLYSMPGCHSSVLAGTALNLENVEEAVGNSRKNIYVRNDWFDPEDASWIEPQERSLERSGLVTTDTDFENLMEPSIRSIVSVLWDATSSQMSGVDMQRIRIKLGPALVGNESIFEDHDFVNRLYDQLGNLNENQGAVKILNWFRSNEIWPHVLQQSLPLRGRFRWSVCYIEELVKALTVTRDAIPEHVAPYTFLNQLVSRASLDVQENVKQPLRQRIQQLENSTDPKRRKLANDVFHMALQAELFSQSRILDTSEAAILIEQAVAYVIEEKDGRFKVCIAERLVVDAVMEYFREKKPANSLTNEYLGSWQYSASSFGFIAEHRLAEAIYTYAHQWGDPTKRASFLAKLDNFYEISANTSAGTSPFGLENFVLEHNPSMVDVALTSEENDGGKDIDENNCGAEGIGDSGVGQWLNHVLRNEPRPTFLLPSTSAGPDVMFVLRNTMEQSTQRIICAVQSKMAMKVEVKAKVQNTLDPDQWYRGSLKWNERAKFLETLDNFKSARTAQPGGEAGLKFLTILLLGCYPEANVNSKKIVDELRERKKDVNFAQDIVTMAENSKKKLQDRERKTKPSPVQLQKVDDNIRVANRIKGLVKRTDYHFKILTHDSVETIFGEVFTRYLRGMKGEKHFRTTN